MSGSGRQRELAKQNRLLVRQEGLCERDLLAVLRPMGAEVAARYRPSAEAEALSVVSAAQPRLADALAKRTLQTALIFGERALDRLERLLPKSYAPALHTKGFRDIFELAISQWVELHALSRVVTITATLFDAVRGVLGEAADGGLGEAQTARMIRDRIGDISLTNAARIARTEMHTAASVGSDEAARSTGLHMVKEWAAAEDTRTRFSHALADGQLVQLNEPFTVGGALLMIPGDPTGPAKEIINCRCAVLHHPVIGGQIIR